jgi:hypothetical protein
MCVYPDLDLALVMSAGDGDAAADLPDPVSAGPGLFFALGWSVILGGAVLVLG